nr:MAG: RNA-dependent RNA polymerase [Porcine picobirnavirus]
MPKSNNETMKVFNNMNEYFKLPNPGLTAYFGTVRQGQPEVYRTPFGKGRSVQQLLAEWMPSLDSLSKQWPTLLEFENDLAKKVGPMSVMFPLKDRLKDIDHYYEDILLPQKPIDSRAIQAVINEFDVTAGVRVRTQANTVELMKKSTNSGNPYFLRKSLVTDETIPCSISAAPTIPQQYLMGDTNWNMCAILGWRGQEGGPNKTDVKQRVVWMFPYAMNIEELRYYQPAIETAQDFNLVPAWVSMESVDQRITRMFDTKAKNDLVVCTDFSKFDQHFNPVMQEAAKEIISSLIVKDSAGDYWLKNVFDCKYYMPLMYDYGLLRVGRHGMGSGSGGTNYDETIVHRALQYEAAMLAHQKLNPNSQCLGDDGIITYPGIKVEDVVRAYSSHGQEMNIDKQYASKQECIYLRRWHHRDYRVDDVCVGVYSTCRALGRLAMQERFYDPEKWSKEAVALRQLSILENCKYHPLREQFVDFCMKRDKFRLGIDIPGFLNNIEDVAKKYVEYMPDFLGYTKTMQENGSPSGISTWWIVSYLQSK